MRYTMSWQRYWLGALPPHTEFNNCVHACLMAKPIENGYVRGHAGNPPEDCCPVLLPQFPPGIWWPEAFIRRSKNYFDGALYNGRGPELLIGRSCDVAKTRFHNPTQAPHVIWRWRENGATKTHLSCRLTSESIILLEPTLEDSIFPQTGRETEETETVYDQLFTLAQAAALPAPFPQSCLNPLP
jgi:hypothetical protein